MATKAINYTTGIWAAAAAKAAALALGNRTGIEEVSLNPFGERVILPIFSIRFGAGWVEARVVRPAADDPLGDLELTARVGKISGEGIQIEAGEGIGRAIVRGLPVPVGEGAINPGPRGMIIEAVENLFESDPANGIRITLAIPNGRHLAKRTLNSSFGIVGGLSILGTRERVGRHDRAHRETILAALRRSAALGARDVRLVRRGPVEPGSSTPQIQVGRHGAFGGALARRMGLKVILD